nr:uncharacterized protein LOC115847679 [Globicephala melas]
MIFVNKTKKKYVPPPPSLGWCFARRPLAAALSPTGQAAGAKKRGSAPALPLASPRRPAGWARGPALPGRPTSPISFRGLPEGGKPGEQSSSGDGPRRLAGCSRPVGPLRRGRAATPGKGVEGGRAPGLALRGRPDGPEREGRPERRRPELRPRPRIRAGLSRARGGGGGGGGGSTNRAPDAARPAC